MRLMNANTHLSSRRRSLGQSTLHTAFMIAFNPVSHRVVIRKKRRALRTKESPMPKGKH
ncbi:hypothetical protein NEOLEDRAFT_1132808 [Neolentinus lepideus HHB14362 ss-1]|uniref:Uncharacterized protein n=1 Tax=Neolentinus lepideus HHB14362 ss-1 TaxID=1314782 RepID=A0A165SXW7_9AGAM|nr:hypothetical protein NEOLEDRAFT_1132808 [Neolentinus lepideus HHB14362 ss-1]